MSTCVIARGVAPPGMSAMPLSITLLRPRSAFWVHDVPGESRVARRREPGHPRARPISWGNVGQRGDDERDVLIEIHAEFDGAAVDIIAVDRARERLVLELLPDRGRLQTADHASRPDESDGVHEAGELVAGVEGAVEARDARQAGVIRVRQDGVDDPLRDAPRQEDLGTLQRMVRRARMHLVVEVVEYAGPTPRVQILAVPASVGAHGGFDGAGVFAEAALFVNSVRTDQAWSREITAVASAGSATCRSISWKTSRRRRAGRRGCAARSRVTRACPRPWRGKSRPL